MKRLLFLRSIIIFVFCFLITGSVFAQAQVREEKEERGLKQVPLEKKFLPPGLTVKASFSAGYDSNVNLSPQKKGDIFEEFLFNLGYATRLLNKLRFSFNYDLDVLNYNEITSASTILNHFRFGLHDKISIFKVGAGYDLAIVYFRNNDDDFFFHKGFAYIGQDLTKKIYHQLEFEYGLKAYTDQKALAGAIAAYQDKDRIDRRWSGIHSIDFSLTPKLKMGFLTRFSVNESNAMYQRFYDYKSYQGSPYLSYYLTDKLQALVNFSYTRKNYNRRVTLGTDKERDNLYVARTGIKYNLNKNNVLALSYAYRDNSSNEDLEEYRENVFSASWQYKF
jgi:hypothetical protein